MRDTFLRLLDDRDLKLVLDALGHFRDTARNGLDSARASLRFDQTGTSKGQLTYWTHATQFIAQCESQVHACQAGKRGGKSRARK